MSTPQPELFPLSPRTLPAAEVPAADVATAAQLSPSVRLGTMTWSYPGWVGTVYATKATATDLANVGLTAYVKHPLLRAVEIDRTYYEPVPAHALRALADQTPDDFRFVVKAHEDCVVTRFPLHARYGKKKGEANPRYLDAAYTAGAVVEPFVEGLGSKGGALLFQFPPRAIDQPQAFARELHEFLTRLPKGVCYAVELRNPELLTHDYADALNDAGAIHCHSSWTTMPSVIAQAKRIPPSARNPLLVRWLLRPGETYEVAGARYAPFDRLVDEDPARREAIARLVDQCDQHGVPAIVLVDNKAEGCAPKSIARLARALVERASMRGAGQD